MQLVWDVSIKNLYSLLGFYALPRCLSLLACESFYAYFILDTFWMLVPMHVSFYALSMHFHLGF
jgi:hypothetical protein